MNIGIVLAVSDYGDADNDLPGCKADGKAMSTILNSDSKFDDVLVLSNSTQSAEVKRQIIDFINVHKENEINEDVFYYTGHGDFNGDEFYFLLSDYDSNKRKQTTLENTELDNLLKALKSNVTIKIVDACHSGKAYIKDSDAFDKYLNDTKGQFDKCYFMYSSQLEQYSYQDEDLSFFTKSIVNSVKEHSASTIRYKDIIDYVSDSFQTDSAQTPFFVVQADFTEQFCSISPSLIEELKSLSRSSDEVSSKDEPEYSNLLDKIRTDAERYCSQEEAYKAFDDFLDNIRLASFVGDVFDLYDYECVFERDSIVNATSIGNWLNKTDHQYFAKPTFKEVTKTKREFRGRGVLGGIARFGFPATNNADGYWDKDNEKNYKTVVYTEQVVSGYEITIDQPANYIEIIANPKFSNIRAGHAFIVPILSKTEMRIFYSFSHYQERGWNDRTVAHERKWLTNSVSLKGLSESKHFELLRDGFSDFLLEPLNRQFEIVTKEQESDMQPHDSESSETQGSA